MLAQGNTWPISNVTPDEVNAALIAAKEQGSAAPVAPQENTTPKESRQNDGEPAKKKRTRTRKRKSGGGEGSANSDKSSEPNRPRVIREGEGQPAPRTEEKREPKDPTVLSLR